MDKSTGCGLFKPQIRDTSYGDIWTLTSPVIFSNWKVLFIDPFLVNALFKILLGFNMGGHFRVFFYLTLEEN